MSDTGTRYQAALQAEYSAWDALRTHALDTMIQEYDNGISGAESRVAACVEVSRLADALAAASREVMAVQAVLVAERIERQRALGFL